MTRTYTVETYGCQMNVHDSERIAGLLDEAGFTATKVLRAHLSKVLRSHLCRVSPFKELPHHI